MNIMKQKWLIQSGSSKNSKLIENLLKKKIVAASIITNLTKEVFFSQMLITIFFIKKSFITK